MDNPTIAELLELILLSESSIDAQSQFWLTVTFATIVASFSARNILSDKLRALISLLYLTSTVVFASRWYYDAADILIYQAMLLELGYENASPTVTAISRVVLMLIGTAATMYFIYYGKSEKDSA